MAADLESFVEVVVESLVRRLRGSPQLWAGSRCQSMSDGGQGRKTYVLRRSFGPFEVPPPRTGVSARS